MVLNESPIFPPVASSEECSAPSMIEIEPKRSKCLKPHLAAPDPPIEKPSTIQPIDHGKSLIGGFLIAARQINQVADFLARSRTVERRIAKERRFDRWQQPHRLGQWPAGRFGLALCAKRPAVCPFSQGTDFTWHLTCGSEKRSSLSRPAMESPTSTTERGAHVNVRLAVSKPR